MALQYTNPELKRLVIRLSTNVSTADGLISNNTDGSESKMTEIENSLSKLSEEVTEIYAKVEQQLEKIKDLHELIETAQGYAHNAASSTYDVGHTFDEAVAKLDEIVRTYYMDTGSILGIPNEEGENDE